MPLSIWGIANIKNTLNIKYLSIHALCVSKMVDEEAVKKILRAVLQSRSPISLSCLQAEYKELTGETIPHKQLGHTTVDALLHSMPSLVQLDRNRSGEVSCSCCENFFFLSHIDKLVMWRCW